MAIDKNVVISMELLPREGWAAIQWEECNRQTRMAVNMMEAHALFNGTLRFQWRERGHTQQ